MEVFIKRYWEAVLLQQQCEPEVYFLFMHNYLDMCNYLDNNKY